MKKCFEPLKKGVAPWALRLLKTGFMRVRSSRCSGVRSMSTPKPLARMSLPRLRKACLASTVGKTSLIGLGLEPPSVRSMPTREAAIGSRRRPVEELGNSAKRLLTASRALQHLQAD